MNLSEKAAGHVNDIVNKAIKLPAGRKILVVSDKLTPLSRLLSEAYELALPNATHANFDYDNPSATIEAFETLEPGDLVVLIQSSSFRLDEFRIRIELFKRGLAVIEHVHLERSNTDDQLETYVDTLAYDPEHFVTKGRAIKDILDRAKKVTVTCEGTTLEYEGGMEPAKLNVGDYSEMKNVGGTFPIGEVFTEPTDLTRVNGEAMLFAFAGKDHITQIHEPFKVSIEGGMISAPGAPKEFQDVLDQISAEERLIVREFGIGLNPGVSKEKVLLDITAFERQLGLHLSLGEKHPVYKKPGLHPKKTFFHIDVFVDAKRIVADDTVIYENGEILPQ